MTHQKEQEKDNLPMYRFLGLVLMAALIAGCQPQTNIQTDLPSLSGIPQDKTAGDNVEWQAAIIEPVPDIAAEPAGTTLTTTESATVEMTALNEGETNEPPTAAAEADEGGMTLADKSSLQIASLAEPESEAAIGGDPITTLEDAVGGDPITTLEDAVGGDSITTLEDALAKPDVAAVLPGEETSQGQALAIEPPKMPDPIHPQTIVGQSIDDLSTSLGLPDFERNDADVVIWQYRLAACVTDFYMYLNGDDYVVTGWAWRPPLINQTMDEQSCQQQIGTLLDANA